MPFVLLGYAPRRVMETRIERMRRIKTDFCGLTATDLIFTGFDPASGRP